MPNLDMPPSALPNTDFLRMAGASATGSDSPPDIMPGRGGSEDALPSIAGRPGLVAARAILNDYTGELIYAPGDPDVGYECDETTGAVHDFSIVSSAVLEELCTAANNTLEHISNLLGSASVSDEARGSLDKALTVQRDLMPAYAFFTQYHAQLTIAKLKQLQELDVGAWVEENKRNGKVYSPGAVSLSGGNEEYGNYASPGAVSLSGKNGGSGNVGSPGAVSLSGKNGGSGNYKSPGAVSFSGENGMSGNKGSSRSLSVCKFGGSGTYSGGKHRALVYAENTTRRNLSVVVGEWLPEADNIFEPVGEATATGNLIIIEDSEGKANSEWKTRVKSRLGELAFSGLLIVGGEKVYEQA